jgi:hypothetical protein
VRILSVLSVPGEGISGKAIVPNVPIVPIALLHVGGPRNLTLPVGLLCTGRA